MKQMLAIASLLSQLFGVAHAATPNDMVEARISRVENGLLPETVATGMPLRSRRLDERMAALKVPGVSIAVINNGTIEWARGYGQADVASGRPVTAHTRFQAASISKAVTAMAALSLVQSGRLALDEDVNGRLRTWKVPDNAFTSEKKVTLRSLLSHTAGIGVHGFLGYPVGQPVPSLLELLDGKAPANSGAVRVEATPGNAWRYSGGGYQIVQLLLTETSGEPFDAFMQHAVLDKIGMRESSFILPAEWEALASNGYLADGSVVPGKWRRNPELAAAGMWTTHRRIWRVLSLRFRTAG